jgi:hypothetical protein
MGDATDLRNRIRSYANQAVAEASRETVHDLRRVLWRDTGDTAERTKVEELRDHADSVSAAIVTPTDQANYQEYGTRPHVIRPRRAKALRFVVGGRVVFAAKVNHPGNKARPRFFPTIRDKWPEHLAAAWGRRTQ